MTLTSEELLRRIAAEDSAAFAEFYDRHAPRVLGLLRHMLNDATAADDALQDTFWQVWRQAARFDPRRASAVSWLVVLARSRGADLRRRNRRTTVTSQHEQVANEEMPACEQGEMATLVQTALAGLPAEQRQVVRLAFFSGLTHEEIAQSESLPLGTVKTRIRLGIHKLRDFLDSPRRALA